MPATQTDRIDGLTTSVAVKSPVRVVATSPITFVGTAPYGYQTIDGIAVTDNISTPDTFPDRVLLIGQSDQRQNGIWQVSSLAWTRTLDFDGARDAVKGTMIYVNEGSAFAKTTWKVATANPFTIGTDSLSFNMVFSPVTGPYNVVTDTGGVLIVGTVGTNTVGARTDQGLVIYAATGHSAQQFIIGDPSEEATRTDYGFDSASSPAQLYSDFSRFVGNVNTASSWRSTNANHMPSGDGDDIVPRIHWSNGATALGCGATAALPWATMPGNTWLHVRSGHDGTLLNNPLVVGTGHAFSTKAGYLLEVNGFFQVGDVDGSGVTDHALQAGWSSGGSSVFLNAFRNSTSAFAPLTIGASQLNLVNLPVNAANDAAAATAGVPVGGFYRNGSVLMVRVT